ncbi:GyrI-like domain-containing protein [Gelidibacter salicanalis]|uniref:GyrI-like domain-containing protein n=1 Tax=Gelidibacter salicanalis TaxID=291193 RepID=A0A934NBA0_9FLAO|nr:GyrI-like domain-containing protein [Gelidibacter salicanalis]MBJ7879390.1 GyrI-like domain-containing protein [Gelidibacter salicanalis]
MKFLKYLLFLLLIAFIGMAIYVAVQPNSFTISESTTINAPKTVVFKAVDDSIKNDRSSFWKSSETLQTENTHPTDSIIQTYTSGRIKQSDLKWIFQSNRDGSTNVTRTLIADRLSFMTKAKFALFGDNVEELTHQFKTDLENLDSEVIESMSVYTITVDGLTDYGGGFYMYKTISSTGSNKSASMVKQFKEISAFMDRHNVTASGMPMSIYIEMNAENGNVIMSNAIPVSENVLVAENSNVLSGYMERTGAVKVTLKGNYSHVMEAWAAARKHLQDKNLEASEMSPFEVYKNDHASLPNPADWITEIYIPIKENAEAL